MRVVFFQLKENNRKNIFFNQLFGKITKNHYLCRVVMLKILQHPLLRTMRSNLEK